MQHQVFAGYIAPGNSSVACSMFKFSLKGCYSFEDYGGMFIEDYGAMFMVRSNCGTEENDVFTIQVMMLCPI